MSNGNGLLLLTSSVLILFLAALDPGIRIARFFRLPRAMLFACMLLTLGIVAEVIFFTALISAYAATILSWFLTTCGLVLAIARFCDPFERRYVAHKSAWAPLAATFASAAFFVSLLAATLPQGVDIIGFAETWPLALPNDNILPHTLAIRVATHAPVEPFVGDWLSSDRPPLQAGFELLFTSIVRIHDSAAAYQVLSMVLQSTAIGMLFTLCRICSLSIFRSALIAVMAVLTGFAFVNTVFVWPKLLAAAFVLVAIALFLTARQSRFAALAIGAAIGLGLLAHGGVVFTIFALVIAVTLQKRVAATKFLVVAALACLTVNAPWTAYQKLVDPPGDRLLKWHLAGQVAPSTKPFITTFLNAYVEVPIPTIMANKYQNLEQIFLWSPIEPQQQREFSLIGAALGVLSIPFIAGCFPLWKSRPHLRKARTFGLIAVGSLVFWALAMYLPKSTVLHQGSYATELLMFFVGGIMATERLVVGVFFAAWQAQRFLQVWPPPLHLANAFQPTCIAALVVLGIIVFGSLILAALAVSRRIPILRRRLDEFSRIFPPY